MTDQELEEGARRDLRLFGVCFYRVLPDYSMVHLPAWEVLLEDDGVISHRIHPPGEEK